MYSKTDLSITATSLSIYIHMYSVVLPAKSIDHLEVSPIHVYLVYVSKFCLPYRSRHHTSPCFTLRPQCPPFLDAATVLNAYLLFSSLLAYLSFLILICHRSSSRNLPPQSVHRQRSCVITGSVGTSRGHVPPTVEAAITEQEPKQPTSY